MNLAPLTSSRLGAIFFHITLKVLGGWWHTTAVHWTIRYSVFTVWFYSCLLFKCRLLIFWVGYYYYHFSTRQCLRSVFFQFHNLHVVQRRWRKHLTRVAHPHKPLYGVRVGLGISSTITDLWSVIGKFSLALRFTTKGWVLSFYEVAWCLSLCSSL